MNTILDFKPTQQTCPRAHTPRPLPGWLQIGVVLLLLWNGLQAIVHHSGPSLAANTDQAAQNVPQARYDYNPYGRATGNMQPTFQYAGYYAHAPGTVSVTPMHAYAPSTGRWVERDPLPAK